MEAQNKLEKFESAVFSEIDEEVKKIEKQAQSEKEIALQKNKEEQLIKSVNFIETKTQEIKRKFKREIAQFSFDTKRNVIKERSLITNRVFDSVINKLKQFIDTPEYDEYFLKQIHQFSKKNLSNIKISVGEKDYIHADKIKEVYSLPCEVILNKEITLGGFIAQDENKGIYFDETLSQKLLDQKTYFIKNSDLFL